MIKKLLSFSALLICSTSAFSQTIPNPGFETWNDLGTYENPDNWITLNILSASGLPISVSKTSDAHSGSYAAKLETVTNMNGIVPGYVLCGNGEFMDGSTNIPFTTRPVRMLFYYKGGPMAGDTSAVALELSRWDTGTNSQVIVGGADFSITSVTANYTLVDLTINYIDAGTPDTIKVVGVSSIANTQIPGSILYLDDISFEMGAAGIYETQQYVSAIYPNPVKNELTIHLEATATSIVIVDYAGRKIDEIDITDLSSSINTAHLNAGVYLYQLKNKDVIVSTGKFTVNR